MAVFSTTSVGVLVIHYGRESRLLSILPLNFQGDCASSPGNIFDGSSAARRFVINQLESSWAIFPMISTALLGSFTPGELNNDLVAPCGG